MDTTKTAHTKSENDTPIEQDNSNDLNNLEQAISVESLNKRANDIIIKSTAKASTVAALPIPLVDVAGVTYVQVKMVEKIADTYGQTINDATRLIITSAVASFIAKLGTELFGKVTTASKLEKVIGESLIKASLAGFVTTVTGELFVYHLKNGGNVDELGFESFKNYVQEQFQSERLSIDNLSSTALDSALNKIGVL